MQVQGAMDRIGNKETLPPIERALLESVLKRSMERPQLEMDVEGNTKLVNKVQSYSINEKSRSVHIVTSLRAVFDMPLHVDEGQAMRILNDQYNLGVEFPEDYEEENESFSQIDPLNAHHTQITKYLRDNNVVISENATIDEKRQAVAQHQKTITSH